MAAPDTSIQDNEYIRKRLNPKPGDADYIHLGDLFLALEQCRTDEKLAVLDYGSGGSPYRSLFPEAEYKRADFAEMSGIDYVIGNNSVVDEADGSFDLIFSTQVAEHVSDPRAYFAESHRLLKTGGRLICTTHGTYPDHGCPYDFQRWTAEGLKRDLEFAGFTVAKMYKLTTNARALMYFVQRFSGWFDTSSSGVYAPILRIYRSFLHRRPKTWHKLADRLFSENQIVDSTEIGHDLYVGLMAVAIKK